MTARFGENLSNVYSALRSIRVLKGVPEEKPERIGERNAHMSTYLPEKERKSDVWLEKAATSPNRGFKREVEMSVQKQTGLPPEEFRAFSLALPKPVYESLCAAEERRRSRGLSVATTRSPAPSAAFTISAPIPLAAPVTNHVLRTVFSFRLRVAKRHRLGTLAR